MASIIFIVFNIIFAMVGMAYLVFAHNIESGLVGLFNLGLAIMIILIKYITEPK